MLHPLVTQLILQEKNIAYAITNRALILQQVGGKLDWVEADGKKLAVGLSLFEVSPELIGCEEELRTLLAGVQPSFQLPWVNREDGEGDLFYVTLSNYAYRADTGEVTGILHIIEDVTAAGIDNQRLTQQRNELILLHQQLKGANLKLEAANAELRALDELKSNFVSIAAHELRTPLASILGYVDFMLDDPITTMHPDHQTGVGIIGKSTKRLLAITNNLLDVTRIEAGRVELTLESLDLVNLIEEVVLHLHPEIEQKHHTFRLEKQPGLPRALCDETRTAQIFGNLLSNAIKYTPPQGQITVDLRHSLQEGMIIAAVSDNGIGIPTQDLQNIGKNFFRASNVHLSRTSGTGLGLGITRSLVELQGGRLWIDSTPGVGSTFYLTFPVDDGIFAHQNDIQ